MKTKFIVLLILVHTPCLLFGQLKEDTKPVDMPTRLAFGQGVGSGFFGILGLDPSRLHISHSYQMSYFSGAGSNGTVGLYLNTMSYQFSNSFDMKLQWGIAHQPFGGNLGNAPQLLNRPFVSGAQLRYQPSDKFKIELNYQSLPYWSNRNYYRSNSFFDWQD